MKNYLYNVNTYGKDDEATFRTNHVRDALDSFLKAKAQGIHCDLLDGCTGEVMAIANHSDSEDHATDEVTLMIKGMVFEALGGEEIPLEAEEDGSEVETMEPDDLFALLEWMVAEGGMPS
jgi:hypothetical protein